MSDVLAEIGERIRTQDNRATSYPLFVVQEKELIAGVNDAYADEYRWIDRDGEFEFLDEEKSRELDEIESRYEEVPDSFEKVGIAIRWRFVTACFTHKACQEYIDANRHNLNQPRIYVASGYRNQEFIAVREYLIEAGGGGSEH